MAIAQRLRAGADVYELTLDSTNISGGFLILPFTPSDPTRMVVDVIGGVPQRLNVDYYVLTNRIIWNALGMDIVVSVGTVLRITYYYSNV